MDCTANIQNRQKSSHHLLDPCFKVHPVLFSSVSVRCEMNTVSCENTPTWMRITQKNHSNQSEILLLCLISSHFFSLSLLFLKSQIDKNIISFLTAAMWGFVWSSWMTCVLFHISVFKCVFFSLKKDHSDYTLLCASFRMQTIISKFSVCWTQSNLCTIVELNYAFRNLTFNYIYCVYNQLCFSPITGTNTVNTGPIRHIFFKNSSITLNITFA